MKITQTATASPKQRGKSMIFGNIWGSLLGISLMLVASGPLLPREVLAPISIDMKHSEQPIPAAPHVAVTIHEPEAIPQHISDMAAALSNNKGEILERAVTVLNPKEFDVLLNILHGELKSNNKFEISYEYKKYWEVIRERMRKTHLEIHTTLKQYLRHDNGTLNENAATDISTIVRSYTVPSLFNYVKIPNFKWLSSRRNQRIFCYIACAGFLVVILGGGTLAGLLIGKVIE